MLCIISCVFTVSRQKPRYISSTAERSGPVKKKQLNWPAVLIQRIFCLFSILINYSNFTAVVNSLNVKSSKSLMLYSHVSSIGHCMDYGADPNKSVYWLVRLIWTFAYTHKPPPGNVPKILMLQCMCEDSHHISSAKMCFQLCNRLTWLHLPP